MPDTCSAHTSMQQRSDERQAPEWDESMRNGNESERLGDERALGVFCVLRSARCECHSVVVQLGIFGIFASNRVDGRARARKHSVEARE